MNNQDKDIVRASRARELLSNELFKDAFEKVEKYIDERSYACSPTDKETATSIIISKQILRALKREIERAIENGKIASVKIEQLERSNIQRMFQR